MLNILCLSQKWMSKEKLLKFIPSLFVIFGVVAFALTLQRYDIFWLTIGVISFIMMIGVVKVEDVPWLKVELIALLLIPLFLGMSGISRSLEESLLSVDIALVILSPTLGFILMFNLHHHTQFKTNLPFSLFFVIIFSLASGGLLGVGEFFSDYYLGTNLVENNFDLMIDLVFVAIGSAIMGVFFKNYLIEGKYKSIESLSDESEFDREKTRKEVVKLLFSGFGRRGHKWASLLSRFLQLVIIIFAIYAVYERNPRWFFSALLSLGVTMIPYIFTRNTNIVIPPMLNLWICAALFFHVLGGVMGYYDDVWWWDIFTHSLSAALISILGFTILLTIHQLSDSLYIPSFLIPAVLLFFILATGVVWEIFEFFCDQLLGTNMQYSLQDTVFDMIFNTVGASIAGLLGYRYFPSKYWPS